MNIKFRTLLGLLALSVTLLTSCLDSDKTTLSDNAKITRFIIYNDSIAGLDHIVLTIDNDNNTIYNADSLAYGTVLDSVYLDIYGSTLASIIINDSITYEDSLIVDLNQPLLVRSFAKNMVAYRDYTVTVSVHQVEPELFVWDGLVTQLSELPQSSEKGVYFNETLFYYYNTSSGISAKSSVNGKSWSSVSCNLPATTQLEELVNYGDKLAVVVDNVLYVSGDGSSWSSVPTTGETVEMALFTLNGTLYGLTTSDIVSLSATNEWEVMLSIPTGFPVKGAAMTVAPSPSGVERAYLVAGEDADGNYLNSVWSTENGSYWANLGVGENGFTARTEAAVIQYSNGLMMFGGKDASGAITPLILYSPDYGLTWKDADAEMEISSLYVSRYGISAVVNDDMIIYLIGGKSGSAFVNDVWSGYQYSQLPGFKN